MKIKYPELIEPVVLYSFSVKNKKYRPNELEELFEEFQARLETILGNLGKELKLFDYRILFGESIGNKIIGHLEGGFDLEIEREWCIRDFNKRYKESFESALKKYREKQFLIDIDIFISGFRDKITSEVEVSI